MIKKKKPTIGVFSLTACAGCQFTILFLGQELMSMIERFNIAHFPLAKAKNDKGPFDIALVEGTPTTKEQVNFVKKIRKRSKFLIALGSCASYGGVASIKNFLGLDDIDEKVALAQVTLKSLRAIGIGEYVKVDYYMRGCPVHKEEFIRVMSNLYVGKKPVHIKSPVCVECRAKGNVCLLQQGKPCMGPITFGGCDALCPSDSIICYGCNGPLPDANVAAEVKLFEKQGMKMKDIRRSFLKFAGTSKVFQRYVNKNEKTN